MWIQTSIVLSIVATVAGCGGLNKPYPAKDRFGLVVPESAIVAAEKPLPGVLRVERVRVSSPFDRQSLVYRTGEQIYRIDYYNEFVADPEALLTGELIRVLSAQRTFESVVELSTLASSRLRLQLTVTQLFGDFRNGSSPLAVIQARAILLRDDAGATTVAGQWTFEATEPFSPPDAEALATAWGRAYGRVIADLSQFLRSAVESTPTTGTEP